MALHMEKHAEEEDTLHEAIFNDRRLTSRNILRWILQVLTTVQTFHKSFASTGDFGILDIKLGPESDLISSRYFTSKVLAALQAGQNPLTVAIDKNGEAASVKAKAKRKGSDAAMEMDSGSDRSASLDFQSKLSLVRDTSGSRFPKGFECQKMTRFEGKQTTSITISYVILFYF
jgi:hypothetical protein